jgi:ribosomal protein L11 methylase PrmA
VLANLLTHTHLTLANEYRRLVAPGGGLILGGMLAGEHTRVAAELGGDGFAPEAHLDVEGWASLLLRRAHG